MKLNGLGNMVGRLVREESKNVPMQKVCLCPNKRE